MRRVHQVPQVVPGVQEASVAGSTSRPRAGEPTTMPPAAAVPTGDIHSPLQRLMLLDALHDAVDGGFHRLQKDVREHAHHDRHRRERADRSAHSRTDRSGMCALCSLVTSP